MVRSNDDMSSAMPPLSFTPPPPSNQVDRARAIYAHGAQLDHPKRAPDYWKQWHEFEVAVGNEDTFRDMLRVKRAVLTSFANETFYDMRDSEAPVQSDAEALAKQVK